MIYFMFLVRFFPPILSTLVAGLETEIEFSLIPVVAIESLLLDGGKRLDAVLELPLILPTTPNPYSRSLKSLTIG